MNGKDYYFLTRDEFEKAIENGDLLEWALVYDNITVHRGERWKSDSTKGSM